MLKLSKALKRPQLTQSMRLFLYNLKAYVRVRSREVGEVSRPVKFNGQVANNMMDLGEQLAWCTWDCVNRPQTACARRYARPTSSTQQTDQQHTTLAVAVFLCSAFPNIRKMIGGVGSI